MSSEAAALREPWEDLVEQGATARFGIWIFISSEVLFFGAFFMGFGYLRILHQAAFALASSKTDIFYGTTNTALLLTSGLTMGLALKAAQLELKRLMLGLLSATILLALAFLVVKGLEYSGDVSDGLVPGPHFALAPPAAQLFFAGYWIITAVHLLHLSIGIVVLTRLVLAIGLSGLPLVSPQVEVAALYWALVDIVWILLYPLIYLGGRS